MDESKLKRLLFLILYFTLLTVFVTWPLITHLGDHLPTLMDRPGDQPQKAWAMWHTARAVLEGQNPFHFDTILYPEGYTSATRIASPVMFIVALPFVWLTTPVVAYNLILMISYVLTGLAAYALCEDIAQDWRAGVLGATVILLFPARQAHALAGHVEFSILAPVLMYMLLFRRTLREPGSIKAAVGAGVYGALSMILHPTTGPYIVLPWTVLYPLLHLVEKPGSLREWPTWRGLLTIGGVASVIALPFLLPLVRLSLNPPERYLVTTTSIANLTADLLTYVLPSPGHPMLGGIYIGVMRLGETLVAQAPIWEYVAYVGLVAVALSGVGLVGRIREGRWWLLIALVALILALGPFLKVDSSWVLLPNDPTRRIPLPALAVQQLPVLGIGRTTNRYLLLAGVGFGVAAAIGLRDVLASLKPRWEVPAMAALVALVIFEYLPEWPASLLDVSMPSAVEALEEREPDGAIFNVPNIFQSMHWSVYYQTSGHGWPMMTGYVERTLPTQPGLTDVFGYVTTPIAQDIVPQAPQREIPGLFTAYDVRFVMYHPNVVPGYGEHLTDLFGEAAAEAERAVLYNVPSAGAPQTLIYGLDLLRWYPLDENGARWLANDASIGVYTPEGGAYNLTLDVLEVLDGPRTLAVLVNGEPFAQVSISDPGSLTLEGMRMQEGLNGLELVVSPVPGDLCWQEEVSERCPDLLIGGIVLSE